MKVIITTFVLVLTISQSSAWPYVEGFSAVDTKSTSCHFLDASPFFRTNPHTKTDIRSNEDLEEIVLLTEFSRFMNAKAMDILQEFAEIKKLYEVKKQFQQFHETPTMTQGVRTAKDLKVIDSKPEPIPPLLFKSAFPQAPDPPTTTSTTTTTEKSKTTTTTTTTAAPTTSTAASTTPGAPDTTTAAPTTTNAPVTTPSTTTTPKPNVFDTLLTGASNTITQLINSIGGTAQSATPTPIWNSVCFLVWFPYHKDKCNQLRCTACAPSIMTADVVCKRASPDMKSTHKCIQNVSPNAKSLLGVIIETFNFGTRHLPAKR